MAGSQHQTSELPSCWWNGQFSSLCTCVRELLVATSPKRGAIFAGRPDVSGAAVHFALNFALNVGTSPPA